MLSAVSVLRARKVEALQGRCPDQPASRIASQRNRRRRKARIWRWGCTDGRATIPPPPGLERVGDSAMEHIDEAEHNEDGAAQQKS